MEVDGTATNETLTRSTKKRKGTRDRMSISRFASAASRQIGPRVATSNRIAD